MRHIESRTQQECVRWFNLAYRQYEGLLFACPNGVATTATQGRILKAEGMVAGVSDLLLLVPNREYHGLCIEMKSKTGVQRTTQKIWQQKVESQGYRYVIARDFMTFKQVVDEHLKNV